MKTQGRWEITDIPFRVLDGNTYLSGEKRFYLSVITVWQQDDTYMIHVYIHTQPES